MALCSNICPTACLLSARIAEAAGTICPDSAHGAGLVHSLALEQLLALQRLAQAAVIRRRPERLRPD